jgi:uncharacterized damage-inducible protein DinB
MSTMDPLKIYEYLTLARERIFQWVRPLSADQYAREFPIGLGSLGRTLTHVLICEWAYVRRIDGREVPPYEQFPFQDESPPPFATLEPAWIDQASRTRAALAAVRDWSTELEYLVTRDDGQTIVRASPADIFTQLALHEVHHRAQAMNMLRQLGVVAEDIDYNTLMYHRRPASP